MSALPHTPPRFDAFTATGQGSASIDPSVTGFLGAHGGYVAALALNAMAAKVPQERGPRSLNLSLTSAVQPGPVDLDATRERHGKTSSTTSARVHQDGDTKALAHATFAEPAPSLEQADTTMPAVPPPEASKPLFERPVDAGVNALVEHRPAAPPLPLTGGDKAELSVWIRLTEDRAVDAASAAFLADSAAPALYGALTEYVPMPSAEIAIHFVDPVSESPWVLAVVRNRIARDGWAIEDGELWAPDGRLLLHSRQLRRILSGRP